MKVQISDSPKSESKTAFKAYIMDFAGPRFGSLGHFLNIFSKLLNILALRATYLRAGVCIQANYI